MINWFNSLQLMFWCTKVSKQKFHDMTKYKIAKLCFIALQNSVHLSQYHNFVYSIGSYYVSNCEVQVNLFQKLATSAEHVVHQNCSECQNKTKTTICVHNMFCRYSELTIFMNNEQSVVILWVSWCKNKSFWQRFTCT